MKTFLLRTSLLAVAAVILLPSATTSHAAMVLIDWSNATPATNPDTNGNYWNTVGNVAAQYTGVTANNLLSTANVATTWDVAVTGLVDKASPQGDVGWGGNGVIGPAGVSPFNQSFATIDGIFSQDSAAVATITFTQLLPSKQYDFSAIGGRLSGGVNGVVTVTIGTGTGGTLNNNGTLLNFSVTSNASGSIALTFKSSNATSGGTSATFNALSILEVPEPASLALAAAGGMLMLGQRRRVG